MLDKPNSNTILKLANFWSKLEQTTTQLAFDWFFWNRIRAHFIEQTPKCCKVYEFGFILLNKLMSYI